MSLAGFMRLIIIFQCLFFLVRAIFSQGYTLLGLYTFLPIKSDNKIVIDTFSVYYICIVQLVEMMGYYILCGFSCGCIILMALIDF